MWRQKGICKPARLPSSVVDAEGHAQVSDFEFEIIY